MAHPIQNGGESFVDQNFLFPNELTGMPVVVVKSAIRFCGIAELLHITGKLREDDFNVVEFGAPLGIPNQGDKAVVVDGAKRRHHFLHGEVALTEQAVFRLFALLFGVVQMHVLDVRAEVLDDGLGQFGRAEVRRGKVPKRGKRIACETLQQVPEFRAGNKQPRRLHQNGDLCFFRHGKNARKELFYRLRGGFLILVCFGANAKIGDLEVFGDLHALQNFLFGFRRFGSVRNVANGVDAGDGQLFDVQIAQGCRRRIVVEGAVLIGKQFIVDVVQFHPVEAEVDRE